MSLKGDEDVKSEVSTFEDKNNSGVTDVGPFMRSLFEEQLYTDVTFSCADSKASISAHRAVLAAKCDFFESLLFGDQKNEAVGMEMQVEISNVPFSVFKDIVKYFYTDEIEFTDDLTVLEIYSAAQSFHIQPLVDRGKIYLESMDISEDNVCSALQVCNARNLEELKNRCIKYIQENTCKILTSADFETCSFFTVREICELEPLTLPSEVQLLEAVLRWIKLQPSHTKGELTRSLLKCVRFLSFSPKEFSEVVRVHSDLLTPEDGLKILMYLNSSTPEMLKALPKWCNKSRRSSRMDHKKTTLLPHYWKERIITVMLKPPKKTSGVTELTVVFAMKCYRGVHRLKSMQFSFQDKKVDGGRCVDFLITTCVNPDGNDFQNTHSSNTSETSFVFPESIIVSKGQTLKVKIAAKISPSCQFLQFQNWCGDSVFDFDYSFQSKPKEGKLNFISEVVYETLKKLNSG